MRIHIAILTVLPMLALAQAPKGSLHDLSELPTLQGTQDALCGFITKENEAKHDLPFLLTADWVTHQVVSVHLTVTKTNQLAELSHVFLQTGGDFPSTWIPIAPLGLSATNAVYFIHLPLDVVRDGLLVLSCGKDGHRSPLARHRDVFVPVLYDKRYTIRLRSYVPMMSLVPDLPPREADGEGPDPDEITVSTEL